MKKAIIAGSTGLIGHLLLEELLSNTQYEQVLSLSRRPLEKSHPKLRQLIVDFDHLEKWQSEINGDVCFCCMGTTRKKTPSKDLYRKIEIDYPLNLACLALKGGATQLQYISALGAGNNAKGFYLQGKSMAENKLRELPYETLHFLRPSLIQGSRQEPHRTEILLGKCFNIINPMLIGYARKYRSIKAEVLAHAMLKLSLQENKGIFIHNSSQLTEIGSTIS